jgi:hypothetical protein
MPYNHILLKESGVIRLALLKNKKVRQQLCRLYNSQNNIAKFLKRNKKYHCTSYCRQLVPVFELNVLKHQDNAKA